MHVRNAVAVVILCAPVTTSADIVELSPGLYLSVDKGKFHEAVPLKIKVIAEANQFAASKGGVAVPVAGRVTMLSEIQVMYDYQFRLMTRAEASEVKPVLADAVVVVDAGACHPQAAPGPTALLPEIGKLDALLGLRLTQ